MTTSAQILAPRTEDALLYALFQKFIAEGLNPNGWQSVQFARIASQVQASTLNSYEVNRKTVFDGGYIRSAKGVYVDLAAVWYGEARATAKVTTVQLRLADAVGAGPYSLAPGQIAVYDPSGVAGGPLYYRSTVQIDIAKSGSVAVPFVAEAAGAKYNVAPNSITLLKTPVPGVAVTSPAIPSQGDILIFPGADAESDDSLKVRCLLKLATLGRGWAADTIKSLLRDNFPAITRILVRDPGGTPGVAEVWCADILGPISAALASQAYAFLKDKKRKPVGNYPVGVYQAPLLSKALTIQMYQQGSTAATNTLAAARLLLFQESIDVADGQTIVFASRVTEELVDVASGAIGVHVTDPVTGNPLLDFTPGVTSAVVFVPAFLPAISV